MKQLTFIRPSLIYFVTAFLCLSFLFSCSNTETSKNDQQEQKKPSTNPGVYKKPSSGFSDTIFISGKSVVFYNADSVQLGKIKSVTEKMIYENNIHDCFYQMKNARMVLKKYWPLIQITETSKVRYLLFIKADKSNICIDLDKQNNQCGIILFDPKKNPQLADMMNIDTELGFYFAD